ncbi:MAG: molecular chaperone DnaJ [Planctomycetota bacterium]|nr:MAG: molecular chaperone DnaJ [Planctomycetota bacterium]
MSKRDPYEVLGVQKNVTAPELKKSYKKLAMKFHPDRNQGDDNAEQKFKEVSEAYDILSDDNKKAVYDQYGHEGLSGQGYGGGFRSTDDIFSHFSDIFGGGASSGGGGSIFDSFFGGDSGGSRQSKGATLRCNMNITLLESYEGCEKTIELKRNEICGKCNGSGAKEGTKPKTCSTCNGQGEVIASQGFFSVRQSCPTCRGNGKIIESPCTLCRGDGKEAKNVKIKVKIPAGIEDSTRLRMFGEGDVGEAGASRGDLHCYIHVAPHNFFHRIDDDLVCEVPVSYTQAVLGCDLEVPTFSGKIKLTVPKGTQSGQIFKIPGRGFKNTQGYGVGNQLVKIVVEIPKDISSEQEDVLRNLAELEKRDVSPKRKTFLEKVKELF